MSVFGYDTNAIFMVVRKVLTKLFGWIWDKIKGFLLEHWKESVIVILFIAVIGMAKILLYGLATHAMKAFSAF